MKKQVSLQAEGLNPAVRLSRMCECRGSYPVSLVHQRATLKNKIQFSMLYTGNIQQHQIHQSFGFPDTLRKLLLSMRKRVTFLVYLTITETLDGMIRVKKYSVQGPLPNLFRQNVI